MKWTIIWKDGLKDLHKCKCGNTAAMLDIRKLIKGSGCKIKKIKMHWH